jgi:hypothetical protein
VGGVANRYAHPGDGGRISTTVGSEMIWHTLYLAAPIVQVVLINEGGNSTLYLNGISGIGLNAVTWLYHLADHLGSVRTLALAFLFLGLLVACVEGPPPERGFGAEELMLDASALPDGWEATDIGEIPGPIADQAHEYERIRRSFIGPARSRVGNMTTGMQSIYRYGGLRTAARKYESKRAQYFKSDRFTPEWTVPSELTYTSPVADRFHLGCTYYSSRQVCRALGQYEEYVVIILIDVYPDSDVTYADFASFLAAMDERIASHLGAP